MPHEEVYKIMKTLESYITHERINSSTDWRDIFRLTIYSDSIMLYSKDNSFEAFSRIICFLSVMTSGLFIQGIPHKGSIAYGTMTVDTERSIYFGQPLIDAYLLQEELHFYGIIIHGSVEEIMFKTLKKHPGILKYECPLKQGKSNHFTVYPMAIESGVFREKRSNIIDSLNMMKFKTSGHLRQYIDNTETYFKYVNKNKIY
jgi:hypothetical protein